MASGSNFAVRQSNFAESAGSTPRKQTLVLNGGFSGVTDAADVTVTVDIVKNGLAPQFDASKTYTVTVE